MQPPSHPTSQLTTFELRDYRRDLEHAIRNLPEHDATRARLRARLDEVLAEQEARNKWRNDIRS